MERMAAAEAGWWQERAVVLAELDLARVSAAAVRRAAGSDHRLMGVRP